MREQNPNPNLPGMLERFRSTLDLEESAWFDLIDMNSRRYERVLRGEEDVPINALVNLTRECDVTLESVMQDDIDFSALSARRAGNDQYLPERYTVGAFSKRISAVNFLNYIEQFYGWRVRTMALRRLQISEAVFQQREDLINLRFAADLSVFLNRYYSSETDFYNMGAYSVITFRDSPIGRTLAGCGSVAEMFELMTLECLPKFLEKNCVYRMVSLTETDCVIEVVPSPELMEAFKTPIVGNRSICTTKVGVTAAIPAFKNLPHANVVETHCIHRGDPCCRLKVDFAWSSKMLSSRVPAAAMA